ncbi:MAG: hypothetical protein P8J20_08015 [Novosphingobium sp.]|nr:hypothetical protein [Novosphingobium sp.]
MGAQEMQLHIFDQQQGRFTGRIESALGNFDVEGEAKDNNLRWDMPVKKPLPMTVKFDVALDGDSMTGKAKMGLMGKAAITGTRFAAEPQVGGSAAQESDEEIGPITGDFVDPQFGDAYVEVDEWRDDPVRHRYVHGGFTGTDARFSIYFPPAEQYERRFFHNTYPLITNSDIGPFPIQFDVAVGNLGFTLDSGAYYLQTNLGGADRAPPADPAVAAYRVNAAVAKFSRQLAAEMYGEHRPYGYLFGGSGGSYQVMGSAEHTEGVWDGFLPYVLGTHYAIPSMFTIRQHALRVLRKRNKFPEINDAIDPGGSGDPYASLNEEEAAALRETTRLGYPLRAFWDHETLTSGYYSNVAPITPMIDPSYVEDFWSKPGYLGTDPDAGLATERFAFDTQVAEVIEGGAGGQFPRQIVLAETPDRDFADAHLVALDGDHAGTSVPIITIGGQTIGFSMAANGQLIGGLKVGDNVRIDNSWQLAMQSYQRHQVPPPEDDVYAWDQYKDENGAPIYPQREVLIGPVGASNTAGRMYNGNIKGKVLVLECLMDIDALPWQADWYRSRVKASLGESFEDNFALVFIDNANHENPLWQEANARIVSYAGALQQGLRDLADWVENGVHPSDTAYEVVDTQVHLPDSASERRGIQPVVSLRANGGECADVAVGEEVRFEGVIEVPPGAGKVVSAEWDFVAIGEYSEKARIDTPSETVTVTASHSYAKPGTYFPALRTASHRQGDQDTAYARVENLARARVVVR